MNQSNHPSSLPDAPGWPIHPAMVSTAFDIPGFRIVRNFGVVQGLTVRSPGIGGGIAASLQSLGGGNVEAYRKLCENARRDAVMQMMQEAIRFDANAIIMFRYDTTEMGQGLTEVLAYGSAVLAEEF